MSERRMLFSAPEIRAILDGTKTQERRVVKLPSIIAADAGDGDTSAEVNDLTTLEYLDQHEGGAGFYGWMTEHHEEGSVPIRCPFGKPGDRIWVPEAFSHFERNYELKSGAEIFYRADGQCLELEPWRPSVHMPRWASRITLEITSVRVQRLQDISDADAIFEGIQRGRDGMFNGAPHAIKGTPRAFYTAIGAFDDLWTKINGAGSWAENPWVWAVEFRRAG